MEANTLYLTSFGNMELFINIYNLPKKTMLIDIFNNLMSTIVNLSYKAKRSLANSMFYKISPDFSPSKLRLPALYMKQNNRTKSQLHSYKKNNKETLTIINNSDYSINQDIQLCEEIVSPSPNPRLKIQYF